MDFPISVPSIGLVDGKFIDENPTTGTPGSLIPSAWGNAVTEEILAVLAAGAIAPVENTNNQLVLAIKKLLQAGAGLYALDTGAANTYVATFSPALGALTDGLTLKVKAKTANTGASTFNPDGLGAKPIVGGSHAALQGGEIIANGDLWLQWNSSIGTGSWVVIESAGGPVQVADATLSRHSLALGQLGGTLATNGFIKIPIMVAGVKRDFYIQWGQSTGTATSVNIAFPVAVANQLFWLGLQDSNGNPNVGLWTYQAVSAGFTAYNIATLTKGSTTVGGSLVANAQWVAISY